jgi:tetratricopeptide (TPR) repeat protein
MHKFWLAVLVWLIAFGANAKEYGDYDPKRLLTVSETPAGKRYGFDVAYCDLMLNALSAHAQNYPPRFASPQDRRRATQDAKALVGMLDIVMIDVPTPNPALLVRAAYANSLAHNLEIPGAAEKADSLFRKLLAVVPSDPEANHLYGTFLAGAGNPREALPYLEKALSLGVVDAAYAIGLAYLALEDKEQALKNLEDYRRRVPADGMVDRLIDAIRGGRIEFKRISK